MEVVSISSLDANTAAALMAGIESKDPRGIATPIDVLRICQGGQCFAATQPESHSQAVYVLVVKNGQAWIDACQGSGEIDFTATLLPAIELQASRLDSVAFQTARRGLVRKAQKNGYQVTGWIMKKDLKK